MPYKKQYRKKFVKKQTRMGIYGAAGSQLLRDVNTLKGLINVEHKRNDTSLNTTIDNTGNFLLLNGIAEGSDSTQRTGRSIKLTSFEMRLQMYGVSATIPTALRVILFCDNQANASLPTTATLLDNTLANGYYISPKNFDERKRYQIMKDKSYQIGPTAYVSNKIFAKWYRKLSTHALYNGSGATQTSITSCAFYLCFISDQPAGATCPGILCQTRVKFIDN